MLTPQLRVWEGEFGNEYTDRNVVDWHTRLPAFQQMLGDLPIKHVLEVGCNQGHNLMTLLELLGDGSELVGLEPNRYAVELARRTSEKIGTLYGHAFDIPFKDGYFDLVFTCGVLIHVSLEDLPRALREIYRVSKRYVLAVEYHAEEETPVCYRGHYDLLWKRDFLRHYQTRFPNLELIRSGYWDSNSGFEQFDWWLLEKSGCNRVEQ